MSVNGKMFQKEKQKLFQHKKYSAFDTLKKILISVIKFVQK